MTVKILINSLGQHTIAGVKQVTNKETDELVAYWVREPRLISYRANEEGGGIAVDFSITCPVAVTTEYAIRADHVVSILDPVHQIEQKYLELVNPTSEVESTEESEVEATEESTEESE